MSENRVALITGAGRGIGATIARTLAAEKTDIAVVDYSDESAAKETLDALKEAGVAARYYKCDVSDFSATKETVDKIVKDFGKIDILVNNAGITADKLIMRMEEADWDRVLSINLKGCFNMIKHVTPYMMRKRYGRRADGQRGAGELCRIEGGHRRAYQNGGEGIRRKEHHGERRRARVHQDRHDRRLDGRAETGDV